MADSSFYKNFGPFDLESIVNDIDCEIKGDKTKLMNDISSLRDANKGEISFLSNKKYIEDFENSNAGAFIVERKYATNPEKNYIISQNPHYTFAEVSRKFYPNDIKSNFFFKKDDFLEELGNGNKISFNSFVHKSAKVGKNNQIGVNSIIGPSVKIGDNCTIGDNVSIYYCKIFNNVKVFSGTKIGTEGFGFAVKGSSFLKIPQIGRVVIKDNVEIGSNVCIDRGSCGDTIINKNCMIDNLVHIAHNVVIDENTIIAAQTGIAGSSFIGKNVKMGGQVGISGHLIIGDNSEIAAKSGVMKNIKDREIHGGYPAQDIKKWHKSTIFLKRNVKNY